MNVGYLSEIFVSFQGEGAHVGRRHLFVRFAGCNLRCRYCDTPDSLQRTPAYTIYASRGRQTQGKNPIAAAELAEVVAAMLESEAPIDAIALTGGEPLTQADFLAAFLGARRLPVPVLLETNGVLPRRLQEVLPFVDVVSMDIKLPSNSHEPAFWDEHARFIALARSKELYVKILVDQSTAEDDLQRAASLLAPIRPPVSTFLQPIVETSDSEASCRPLIDGDRLAELYSLMRRHLPSIRVLPQVHKLLGIR